MVGADVVPMGSINHGVECATVKCTFTHNRRKCDCKECGGSGRCPHGGVKYSCK